MIIVLDGPNGTGKSALARALSARRGWPVYRAFRRSSGEHFDGELRERLRGLGIPVNTYVDDMYVADALFTTKCSAILDRSLPSGIAYGVAEGAISWGQSKELVDIWAKTLNNSEVALVQMEAARHVREERAKGRRFDFDLDEKVGIYISAVFSVLSDGHGFPLLNIDTTSRTKEETHGAVDQFLEVVCQL